MPYFCCLIHCSHIFIWGEGQNTCISVLLSCICVSHVILNQNLSITYLLSLSLCSSSILVTLHKLLCFLCMLLCLFLCMLICFFVCYFPCFCVCLPAYFPCYFVLPLFQYLIYVILCFFLAITHFPILCLNFDVWLAIMNVNLPT